MAVAFVTVRDATAATTANLAIATSFTCTGTDAVMVFPVEMLSTTVSVTAVTWSAGGTPQRIARQASPSGAVAEIWGISAPTHGSGSATAHFSASVACDACLLLFTGADSTNAFPTADAVFATSTVANVTLIPTNMGANDISVGYGVNINTGNWNSFTTNQRSIDNVGNPGHIVGDSAGTTKDTFANDGTMGAGQVSYVSVRVRVTVVAAAAGWGPLLGLQRNNMLQGNY